MKKIQIYHFRYFLYFFGLVWIVLLVILFVKAQNVQKQKMRLQSIQEMLHGIVSASRLAPDTALIDAQLLSSLKMTLPAYVITRQKDQICFYPFFCNMPDSQLILEYFRDDFEYKFYLKDLKSLK